MGGWLGDRSVGWMDGSDIGMNKETKHGNASANASPNIFVHTKDQT